MIQRYIFTLLFIFSFIQVYSKYDKKDILTQLDDAIASTTPESDIRHTNIDSLMHLSSVAHSEKRFDIYRQLNESYFNYQNDSALHYAAMMRTEALVLGDAHLMVLSDIQLSLSLGIMGSYHDALTLLDSVRPKIQIHQDLVFYYHARRTVCGWAEHYYKNIPHKRHEMDRLVDVYRDSIMIAEKDPVSLKVCMVDDMIDGDRLDEAEKLLDELEQNAEGQLLSYTLFNRAVWHKKHGNVDEQMHYLALTALSDIRLGVKEYAALQELAFLLYEQGDIERAYRYIMRALDDAAFCDARLRSIEIADIYPIITNAYEKANNSKRRYEILAFSIFLVLSFLIVCMTVYLYFQNKHLKVTRRQLAMSNDTLEQANADLEKANRDLSVADKIKEKYITIYLERCRNYIDRAETRRQLVLRYARAGQVNEILKELKSANFMEDEKKIFYNEFDIAFLNICPRFVEEFNNLMHPEHQIVPKNGERLNAELRIFALVRLGISDPVEIAKFLDYSVPTIYNYQSRVRNHARVDKEEFNRRIKTIG